MIKLTTIAVDGGPFNCQPSREVELEGEKILCNNVIFHWEFNPHNVRLWVIGNEFGVLGAAWADSSQDALDELCDAGLTLGLAIEEADADNETDRLGNAGEPHDLTHCWIQTVRLVAEDYKLIALFAEARGVCSNTL